VDRRLTLTKKAELIETYWHYDNKLKKGSWKTKKINPKKITPYYLHDLDCFLEKGIILRDIFRFMNKGILLWDILVGNWCKEIVKEGLSKKCKIKKKDILYLECYWHFSKETYSHIEYPELSFSRKLEFHGKAKEGEFCWSVEMTPAYELAPYPVKVDNKLLTP